MTNEQILIVIIASILVPVLIMLLIIFLTNKKKSKTKVVNVELFNKIFEALGTTNIKSVERQQDRVRLILNDVKLVDAKVLSDLKIPAFLKGNEIKLLFKDNSDELVKYISTKVNK